MISVVRPVAVPARLSTHGVPHLARISALFDASPALYSRGPKTLPIDEDIYGHASVKNVLQQAQFDKCCYCEGRFRGLAAGDVEHFRPKAFSQQAQRSARLYPGYYWLAYNWNNLLFSCQTCNRSHKRNLFPLSNPSRRVQKRTHSTSREKPLLIDPSGPDDPRDHIRFYQEVPRGVTRRGQTTIELLKLDRSDLNDRRRELLVMLKRLADVVDVMASDQRPEIVDLVADARQGLIDAQRPDAPFSSMACDLINPPP